MEMRLAALRPIGRRHPAIEAHSTIAGVRAGRDEVLERALAYVRSEDAP